MAKVVLIDRYLRKRGRYYEARVRVRRYKRMREDTKEARTESKKFQLLFQRK